MWKVSHNQVQALAQYEVDKYFYRNTKYQTGNFNFPSRSIALIVAALSASL